MCTFGVLGLSCEAPAAPKAFQKHHQNSTKGPLREARKSAHLWCEREKKSEILGAAEEEGPAGLAFVGLAFVGLGLSRTGHAGHSRPEQDANCSIFVDWRKHRKTQSRPDQNLGSRDTSGVLAKSLNYLHCFFGANSAREVVLQKTTNLPRSWLFQHGHGHCANTSACKEYSPSEHTCSTFCCMVS